MKPIKEKAWAVVNLEHGGTTNALASGSEVANATFMQKVHADKERAFSEDLMQEPYRVIPVLIIDPRHFDVVAKKKGKVKRGK